MSRHWLPAQTELRAGELRGLKLDDVGDGTKQVSSRLHDPICSDGLREEPIVQPIALSTTYRIPTVDHYNNILNERGRIYTRLGSPTCDAVEAAVNQLEGGAGSVVFSSGMAAISAAFFAFLKSGDHMVMCHPLYSGTQDLAINHLRDRYNIEVSLVGYAIDDYRKAIKPNTRLLYGETPCNPVNTLLDLEGLSKLANELRSQGHGPLVTVIDSTYAPPYIQKPIKHGIDIVAHSATKYLGGHSDLLAGVLTARTVDQWKKLLIAKRVYGGIVSPFDASLLLRGLKSLHVRVDRQCDSAQRLAEYLESRNDFIDAVYYPGLKSNPGHEVAKKQMKKFGGMISFEVKGGLQAAKTLVESFRLINLAVSLGGTESLVEHPATMTHGPMVMTNEERREGNISDGLIRLSVGLEDVEDLINDFEQAFGKVKAALG